MKKSVDKIINRQRFDIPLNLIANNAGAKGDVIVDAVRKEAGAYGYDALNNQFVDMF